MTTTYDFTEIDICVDCLFFHTYGDLPDGATAERIAEIEGAVRIPDGATVEPGCGERFFSSHSCDACGSTLGGDRLAALLVEQLPVLDERVTP